MEPLRLIQVGMGGFGRNWQMEHVRPLKAVDTVGYVDPSPDSQNVATTELNIQPELFFATTEEALESVQCDAVLVTASLPGHVPAARAALLADKDVLMEKPFAPSVAEARELVALAEERDRTLMISQNYRFFPAAECARQIVASGSLGALGVIHIDFRRNHMDFDEGRRRHFELPHPLLADMAIHHFDLMRMITGLDARRVLCHAFSPPWSHFSDPPAATATVEMENDTIITYRGSWVSPGEQTAWAGEWHLEFENGELWFTSRGDGTAKDDQLWTRAVGKTKAFQKLPALPGLDRTGSLLEFTDAVAQKREPVSSGRRNIGSIGLTYAAIESAESGEWTPVER